jgi:hypothetical protein
MDTFYEIEVTNCIAPKGRCERHGEFLEALKLGAKFNTLDIVDNIE